MHTHKTHITSLIPPSWCQSEQKILFCVISASPQFNGVVWKVSGQGHSHLSQDMILAWRLQSIQNRRSVLKRFKFQFSDHYIMWHKSVRKISSCIIHRSIIQISIPPDLAAHQHLCSWLNTCMNSCVSSVLWFHKRTTGPDSAHTGCRSLVSLMIYVNLCKEKKVVQFL